MALKQRAEQTSHTEALGWEEEDEGMLDREFHNGEMSSVRCDLKEVSQTSQVCLVTHCFLPYFYPR